MIPGHVLKVRWFVTRFPETDQIIHGMCKASGIRPRQGNGDFTPKQNYSTVVDAMVLMTSTLLTFA